MPDDLHDTQLACLKRVQWLLVYSQNCDGHCNYFEHIWLLARSSLPSAGTRSMRYHVWLQYLIFLFVVKYHSIVWTALILFISFCVDGHLGCFYLGLPWIMLLWVSCTSFCVDMFSFFLGIVLFDLLCWLGQIRITTETHLWVCLWGCFQNSTVEEGRSGAPAWINRRSGLERWLRG